MAAGLFASPVVAHTYTGPAQRLTISNAGGKTPLASGVEYVAGQLHGDLQFSPCGTAPAFPVMFVNWAKLDASGGVLDEGLARTDSGVAIGANSVPCSNDVYHAHWEANVSALSGAAVHWAARVYGRTDWGQPAVLMWQHDTRGAAAPPGAPSNPRVTQMTSGGKSLTMNHLAALALRAGWGRARAIEATAIGWGESSGLTKAVSYTGCCHGVWQINTQVHPYTVAAMFDPYQNVGAAKKIYENAGSWQPWQAYTGPDGVGSDGPWLDFKAAATTAVDEEIASGSASYAGVASAPESSAGWSVTYQWDAPTPNATTYEVQRSDDGGVLWTTIKAATSALAYVDTGRVKGSTYQYRVRGTNSDGTGPWSVVIAITVAEYGALEDQVVDPVGSSAGDPADPNATATNCGLSMICYIKAALRWAFVPSEGWTAWQNLKTNLQTKPPFSIAWGASTLVYNTADNILAYLDLGPAPSAMCHSLGLPDGSVLPDGGFSGNNEACVGQAMIDLHATASGSVWFGIMRNGLGVLLIIATSGRVWRILQSAFGSSDAEASAASVASHSDDDGKDKER